MHEIDETRVAVDGAIISALSVILFAERGYSADYVGVLCVGLLLLVVGALWK